MAFRIGKQVETFLQVLSHDLLVLDLLASLGNLHWALKSYGCRQQKLSTRMQFRIVTNCSMCCWASFLIALRSLLVGVAEKTKLPL